MSLSFSVFGFSFARYECWVDILRIQLNSRSFTAFSLFKTSDWDDHSYWEMTILGITYRSDRGWVL